MKKGLIKKALAVSLSIAMACSFVPTRKPVTASAAKAYVNLRTKFKTLQVGKSTTMTLKNNSINWKIQSISSNDTSIAKVSNKTTKDFKITAVSAGRATVSAKLKTTARKTKNTKTVKCRVNVPAAQQPDNPTGPSVETSATVQDQNGLTAALANKDLTKITINATTAEKFEIPAGTYSNVDLVVNAPLSDVTNAGVFKSIEIQAIKGDTWFENANGNAMKLLADNVRLVVGKGFTVKSIDAAKANGVVKLEVNGKVTLFTISAKATVDISGTPEAAIPVTIAQAAGDTKLTSSVKLDVTVNAAVTLTFAKGAEGSTVNVKTHNVKATVVNNTTSKMDVTKADGTKTTVDAGKSSDILTAGTTPGGSTGGNTTNNKPSTGTTTPSAIKAPNVSAVTATAKATVSVTSGSSVSSGAAVKSAVVTATVDVSKASCEKGTVEYKDGDTWKTASGTVTLTKTISNLSSSSTAEFSVQFRAKNGSDVSSVETKTFKFSVGDLEKGDHNLSAAQ